MHARIIVCYIVGMSMKDLNKYPICGLDRFNCRKDDDDDENCNRRNDRSKKIFWYFPIIPYLKCWFINKKELELLRWYKEKKK
jgi:hypothetical protein